MFLMNYSSCTNHMASSLDNLENSTKKSSSSEPNTIVDFLSELLYNSEALEQHNLKEAQIEHAFKNFLRILSKPPIYTTLLINSLALTRQDAISRIQTELGSKHKHPIDTCPHVPEAVMMRADFLPQSVIGTKAHIVVDYKCGMSVLRGADVYAPGLLALSSEAKLGDLVSVFADVEGTCTKGMQAVSREEHQLVFVGNGLLRIGRDVFKGVDQKKGLAIEIVEPLYSAPPLNGLIPDIIYPQNLPSMLVTEALGPKPGEVVLDMCAAPGGKTLHIGLKMLDKGLIIALDNRQSRVNLLETSIHNFKLNCVKTFVFNSTKCYDSEKPRIDNPDNLCPPFPPESFDRILVDAPCSGLGQRPQFSLKINLGELKSYPPYQKQFLSQAVSLLKPGGTLVYSTCTINPLENEANIAWALNKWPQLRLVDVGVSVGGEGIMGHGLSKESVAKVRRFGPSLFEKPMLNPFEDTIGFFIAKLIKIVT